MFSEITFNQGAIAVITTLASVVSVLFAMMLAAQKAQLKIVKAELEHNRHELDECKQDREKIWVVLRDMPNPRFCTHKDCVLRDRVSPGPLHVLFDPQNPITANKDAGQNH